MRCGIASFQTNVCGQNKWGLVCYNTPGNLDTSANFEAGKMENEFRKFMKAIGKLNIDTFTQEVLATANPTITLRRTELNPFILL